MSQPNVYVRKLNPDDAEAFWQVRLLGVQQEVDAFYASYEENKNRDLAEIARMLEPTKNSFVMGVFADDSLAGIAGFFRAKEGYKVAHKGVIWGVFLKSEYRGKGLAKKLLLGTIDNARQVGGIELIFLSVNASNPSAIKAYEAVGFKIWGLEKKAMKIGKRYVDENHMVLSLVE